MKRLLLMFLIFITLLLQSCRPLDYGDKYENVRWTSIDPEIEFKVYDKQNAFNEGTLKIDDKEIDIYATWGVNLALKIFYKDKVENKEHDGLCDDEIAIRGIYEIKNKVIKLRINIDNAYDYKYEYITFVMSEL